MWVTHAVSMIPLLLISVANAANTAHFINKCPYNIYFWTIGPPRSPSRVHDHNEDDEYTVVPPHSTASTPLENTSKWIVGISLIIRDLPYFQKAPAGILQVEYHLEPSKNRLWYELSAIRCDYAAGAQHPTYCPLVAGGVKLSVRGQSKGHKCPKAYCQRDGCFNMYMRPGSWKHDPTWMCNAGVDLVVETCTERVGPRTFDHKGLVIDAPQNGDLRMSQDGTCGVATKFTCVGKGACIFSLQSLQTENEASSVNFGGISIYPALLRNISTKFDNPTASYLIHIQSRSHPSIHTTKFMSAIGPPPPPPSPSRGATKGGSGHNSPGSSKSRKEPLRRGDGVTKETAYWTDALWSNCRQNQYLVHRILERRWVRCTESEARYEAEMNYPVWRLGPQGGRRVNLLASHDGRPGFEPFQRNFEQIIQVEQAFVAGRQYLSGDEDLLDGVGEEYTGHDSTPFGTSLPPRSRTFSMASSPGSSPMGSIRGGRGFASLSAIGNSTMGSSSGFGQQTSRGGGTT
ncbi:hypothetical protein GQ44DRAFT_766556 [Phaeosphaeriaceae sp. PMI808]|nr:hypothetical protein GQ44DRAFT_766556 [Phaeosphaeriaceae sp. PMI808]